MDELLYPENLSACQFLRIFFEIANVHGIFEWISSTLKDDEWKYLMGNRLRLIVNVVLMRQLTRLDSVQPAKAAVTGIALAQTGIVAMRTLDASVRPPASWVMRKIAFLSFALLTACAAHGGDRQTGSATGLAAVSAPPASASRSTAAPAPAAGQGDTLARIRALAGTPSCSDDSQCKTLALGARPCGGPESYLAYSTAHAPEAELRALGERYGAERRAAHAQAGLAGDCRFTPDPGAVCRAGSCTLGAAQPVAR